MFEKKRKRLIFSKSGLRTKKVSGIKGQPFLTF